MQNYELFITETPEDEEVAHALSEAKQETGRQWDGASTPANQERINVIESMISIASFIAYIPCTITHMIDNMNIVDLLLTAISGTHTCCRLWSNCARDTLQ